MTLMILVLLGGLLCFPTLRSRVKLPLILLTLFVLIGGISTSYALSGKFALLEFLKLIVALCVALILLMIFPGEGVGPGRRIATILEGSTALAALLSVDLISTRIFSTPVLAFLSKYSGDFVNLSAVVPGVRLTSIFENSNIFGACGAVAICLSLGLVLSSQGKKERFAHLCCLYIIAVAFVAAFSMGSIASIAVAFLVYFLIERKEKRGELLCLMIEMLVLTAVSIVVISATSFEEWRGFNIIPLLCLMIGAVLLCLLDRFIGQKLGEKLRSRGKLVVIVIVSLLVAAILFAVVAVAWTGPATLEAGESLYRAAYLDPGQYSLIAKSSSELQISVITQNKSSDNLFSRTTIYSGPLSGTVFEVPEESLAVYFDISAKAPGELSQLEYIGLNSSGSIPLNYKLIPDFIAHRMQGLLANQSLLERIGLFRVGLRLFTRSPIIGLGLGSFENAIFSVYFASVETKYVHNHYIQTMLESGIIGLIFFVGTLGISLACVLVSRFGTKKEQSHPLTPALGAALIFMIIHAFVEVDFSVYQFLPVGFGVIALINLCCGDAISPRWLAKKAQSIILIMMAVLLIFFAVLLGNNMTARRITNSGTLTFSTLEKAAKMDKFEWADYKLSYVMSSLQTKVTDEIEEKAAGYAEDLSKLSSNTVPLLLTEYYLVQGNVQKAFEMADKYASYTSVGSWNGLFDVLAANELNSEEFYSEFELFFQKLLEYDKNNLRFSRFNQSSWDFISKVTSR